MKTFYPTIYLLSSIIIFFCLCSCRDILPPSQNTMHPNNFRIYYVVKQITHITLPNYHIWLMLDINGRYVCECWLFESLYMPRISYNLSENWMLRYLILQDGGSSFLYKKIISFSLFFYFNDTSSFCLIDILINIHVNHPNFWIGIAPSKQEMMDGRESEKGRSDWPEKSGGSKIWWTKGWRNKYHSFKYQAIVEL